MLLWVNKLRLKIPGFTKVTPGDCFEWQKKIPSFKSEGIYRTVGLRMPTLTKIIKTLRYPIIGAQGLSQSTCPFTSSEMIQDLGSKLFVGCAMSILVANCLRNPQSWCNFELNPCSHSSDAQGFIVQMYLGWLCRSLLVTNASNNISIASLLAVYLGSIRSLCG